MKFLDAALKFRYKLFLLGHVAWINLYAFKTEITILLRSPRSSSDLSLLKPNVTKLDPTKAA